MRPSRFDTNQIQRSSKHGLTGDSNSTNNRTAYKPYCFVEMVRDAYTVLRVSLVKPDLLPRTNGIIKAQAPIQDFIVFDVQVSPP